MESIRLIQDFIASRVQTDSGLTWVKFLRVGRDLAVGDPNALHIEIARGAGVALLYQYHPVMTWRKIDFGAHDHGHIRFTRDGVAVYVYGGSSMLGLYDSSGSFIEPPKHQTTYADLTPEQRYDALEHDSAESERYERAQEVARIDTCRAIAPLFLAVINNCQLYWSLKIHDDGSPRDDALTLFESS